MVQDSTSLPSVLTLEAELEVDDKVAEDARVSVERFLQVRGSRLRTPHQLTTEELFSQELVLDGAIGHTPPVFQFLCPLDTLLNEDQPYGGVWGLLSGLAYFLTPGHEEEEVSHICFSSLSPHFLHFSRSQIVIYSCAVCQ